MVTVRQPSFNHISASDSVMPKAVAPATIATESWMLLWMLSGLIIFY